MSTLNFQVPAIEHPAENEPGYLHLYRTGLLRERSRQLRDRLSNCQLCPRRCRVNRTAGKTGFCGIGSVAKVAAVNIHRWEEPVLSGNRGSGTIFFSGCTLKCVFCQNYPISQMGVGRMMSAAELAEGMLKLQAKGAHNLNLVTATHQMPMVVDALLEAIPEGLRLPIVHNCSGYERVEILRLLEGIVDIYLPDIKYADRDIGRIYSSAEDYTQSNRAALNEMWRQVGSLELNHEGLAIRGMLVRHLVLPGDLAATENCLGYLKKEFGSGIWVSLMHQYFPAHRALDYPPLNRKTTAAEYRKAREALYRLGLLNGFVQDECVPESVA